MAESIYKRGRHRGFTTVYRSAAQDRRLSLKARGLFLLLQSLPEDWKYTQAGLAHVAGVGRDQIRSALAELEDAGYLTAEQSHDEAGKFAGAVYVLHDEAQDGAEESTEEPEDNAEEPPLSENPTTVENPPLSGNPSTGKPTTEKPSTENPTQQNNNINNNNKHTPLTPHGRDGAAAQKNIPKWDPEHFATFWSKYRTRAQGKAGGRIPAAKAWDKLRPDRDTYEAIMIGIGYFFSGDMQKRGYGIPHASTWLNQRRWEDETPPDDGGQDDRGAYPMPPWGTGGYML